MQTVSISLFRFRSVGARLWAFAQMGLARRRLAATPDLLFFQMMGTGVGEGFTPAPNTGVYAILGVWPSERAARDGVGGGRVLRRYRKRAAEHWTVFLRPISSRGLWSGVEPFHPVDGRSGASAGSPGVVAALTRASIKPSRLLRFWRHEPAISARIAQDPNVRFKIGMGEIPWLRQVTFSIWRDGASMARFARRSGPHAEAIKAVRERGYFSEELYARFEVVGDWGSWDGLSPIAGCALAPKEEELIR